MLWLAGDQFSDPQEHADTHCGHDDQQGENHEHTDESDETWRHRLKKHICVFGAIDKSVWYSRSWSYSYVMNPSW